MYVQIVCVLCLFGIGGRYCGCTFETLLRKIDESGLKIAFNTVFEYCKLEMAVKNSDRPLLRLCIIVVLTRGKTLMTGHSVALQHYPVGVFTQEPTSSRIMEKSYILRKKRHNDLVTMTFQAVCCVVKCDG